MVIDSALSNGNRAPVSSFASINRGEDLPEKSREV